MNHENLKSSILSTYVEYFRLFLLKTIYKHDISNPVDTSNHSILQKASSVFIPPVKWHDYFMLIIKISADK